MKKMIDRDLPLKKEIAENIKRLMKERGWTQIKLSEISTISKSTLSDYINCKTLINCGNVEKLSEAFNVKKADIDPSFKQQNDIREKPFHYAVDMKITTNLPIVGTISCGNGIYAFEDIEGYKDIPNSWIKGTEHFLLRARGDSMINARIEDGDLLLIRKQETFENGEIMAVIIDDEAVLKRIYKSDGTVILQSENVKYPPKFITDQSEIRVIGKLKMNLIHY